MHDEPTSSTKRFQEHSIPLNSPLSSTFHLLHLLAHLSQTIHTRSARNALSSSSIYYPPSSQWPSSKHLCTSSSGTSCINTRNPTLSSTRPPKEYRHRTFELRSTNLSKSTASEVKNSSSPWKRTASPFWKWKRRFPTTTSVIRRVYRGTSIWWQNS